MSRDLKPCGTRAAYQRHMRAGEEPCDPCRDAMRSANRQFEESRPPRKRNRRELKPCGTRAAYNRHRRNGETPCDACRAANSAATSSRARPSRQQSCGTYAGHVRHVKAGERPCEGCRRAKAEYMARYRRQSVKAGPVEVPRVVQGPEGVGPCTVSANGFVWDPVRDDETLAEARERQRVAAAICRTQCPVFSSCRPLPQSSGVVAGVKV